MRLVTVAVVAALFSVQVQAAEAAVAAHTELKDCVIQAVLPGKDMTGAYMRFIHRGAPVGLVRAEIPDVSRRIELHSMAMEDGVMKMTPMTDLTLEAGERLFRKGGDHVMLFDIASPPAVGSGHTMTVYFDDNTQASCEAVVKSLQEIMKDAGHGAMPKNH